jgi:hypothetical protein
VQRLACACVVVLLAALLMAQTAAPPIPGAPPPPLDYVCPMDPGVRSASPGKCPRCGMTLVLGIPDAVEYPLELTLNPRAPKPHQPVDLRFQVKEPRTGAPVKRFEVVHEKLFHLFIVSQDLEFFLHDHPVKAEDGSFHYQAILPKTGMYRLLGDYYPAGGTPQLTAKTIFVPGGRRQSPHLDADLAVKHTANMEVQLTTEPPVPVAGLKTMLFFHLSPADGLEPYLGAWAHMLAASDDLVDLIHTHPFAAGPGGGPGPQVQFNVIFPRARTYRMWVQFQRQGVVNTAIFTLPVAELK